MYANKFVEKPSNYKEALKRFIPAQVLDKLSREKLIYDYNLYRNVAREMYEYGSYVYGELCEELARGGTGLYNRRNREDVRGGNVTRHELERIIAETRIFRLNPEKIKYITELFGKQALEKLKIPKHPHENQNSRDVSAFSFAGNPLSEQALKAKAEFETPLDKLEKVSRERLHKTERNIQDFGKRIGVPVHFVYHPDRGYRGVCIHNGGIYINLNSNVPARRIFMHEFVHWLKASGKENNEIFTALASVIETKQGTLNPKQSHEK